MHCCPSNLLWFNSPPYPLPCVNKYRYCTHVYSLWGGGGGMGFWASDRLTTSLKSLYRSIFSDILHCLLMYESYLFTIHSFLIYFLLFLIIFQGFVIKGINHTGQIFLTRPSVSSCVRHGCNPLERFPASGDI